MKNRKYISFFIILAVAGIAVPAFYINLSAHCDTLDGPVVKAAQNSLENGNVNLILIWVNKEYEDEVIKSFNKTLEVSKAGSEAKELAQYYFYETVVRLHRSGENEPYTGVKPAGLDMGPAIPAGDNAIEEGSLSKVAKLISEAVEEGLEKHFRNVMEKKNYDPNNVEAGREYVKAYVEYIHYIENLYNSAKNIHSLHNEKGINTEEHR